MDALDQIGDTVIDALAAYFKEPHNRGIVERLTKEVKILEAEKPATQYAVAGKTVVFTGSLEKMTREEAKAMAERLGAKVVRLGVEEDRLRRRRPGRGLEARQGARSRRHGADRGRVVRAGGEEVTLTVTSCTSAKNATSPQAHSTSTIAASGRPVCAPSSRWPISCAVAAPSPICMKPVMPAAAPAACGRTRRRRRARSAA